MKERVLMDITPWCRIRIDREGRWFYEDKEIIHQYILHTFYEALERCEDGRYRIVFGNEVCYIEVEDTPFVVATLRGDNAQGFCLILNSGKAYALDPSTLWIEKDNVFYAQLPNGMPVRLSRPAYYALALAMEEDPGGDIVLKVGGNIYTIAPAQPRNL